MKTIFGILALIFLLMWAIRLFMRRPRYPVAPPNPVKPEAKIFITLVGGPMDGNQVWTTTAHIRYRVIVEIHEPYNPVKPAIDRNLRIVDYERDPENANIFNYKEEV